MFGEGALSASFIPVYAALLARGEDEEADRVAGAVGTLLALIVTLLVLVGVLATPLFIAAIAPGFHGEKRDLTIQVVRILFPGIGLLVMSAWCLGVLNSHRRFLLSYSAPVLSSVAIIVTLLMFGPKHRAAAPGRDSGGRGRGRQRAAVRRAAAGRGARCAAPAPLVRLSQRRTCATSSRISCR